MPRPARTVRERRNWPSHSGPKQIDPAANGQGPHALPDITPCELVQGKLPSKRAPVNLLVRASVGALVYRWPVAATDARRLSRPMTQRAQAFLSIGGKDPGLFHAAEALVPSRRRVLRPTVAKTVQFPLRGAVNRAIAEGRMVALSQRFDMLVASGDSNRSAARPWASYERRPRAACHRRATAPHLPSWTYRVDANGGTLECRAPVQIVAQACETRRRAAGRKARSNIHV
jgi:hypothetical protein